ncbi:MAG: hydroxymethylglutaryl-CoA reductase [Patescibacteria group bacterium]|nr:hydroxymethylglutaryl-CoA reductase [Patescibacteria group bacterium]
MKKLKYISNYLKKMDKAKGQNIENMVGCVQVPVGIAGPIKLNNKNYNVPIATTEGALVASINRGCKAIRKSKGFKVLVKESGTTRGPVFRVRGIKEGQKLIKWVEKNFKRLDRVAKVKHLKLLSIKPQMLGKNVWLRFNFKTDEAMGMNMVTVATQGMVSLIEKELKIKCVSLSGNYCVDKKPSWLNFTNGRGKQVWAEVMLSRKTIKDVLKTTPEKIIEVVYRKQLLGSIMSGSMGFNGHYANIIAGVFLATGQDMAHVVEGSMGVTTAEMESGFFERAIFSGSSTNSSPQNFNKETPSSLPAQAGFAVPTRHSAGSPVKESPLRKGFNLTDLNEASSKKVNSLLYFSIYLPSLMVGTVGGGTHLVTQKEALKIMGLGNKKGDSLKLAEIIGGVVLAGELSLTAALANGDLAKAHERLGRGK